MSESSSGEGQLRKDIAIVAGPREWGDTRESWLARVPRKVTTVTFRTVKALWYGEITDPMHWAARDIRRAAELIEARKEARANLDQLSAIAEGLRATDENFHRNTIIAIERALDAYRRPDRT